MSIDRDARVNKFWLAPETNRIGLVEFEWTFSALDRPGVESLHAGIVSISPAGLPQSATAEAIVDAVDDAIAPEQLAQIVDFQDMRLSLLYEQATSAEVVIRPLTTEEVDAEAERRIDQGFMFEGVLYQCRTKDRENIAGAKSAATDAIILFSAQAGNFAWQRLLDPTAPEEFRWIAADNSTVAMDAPTTTRFGYTALGWKQRHIFAARAIKNMAVIPADFATNPDYWPVVGG